ncbi:MAG: HigA family addiction module antitoxin [Bryobacterales bacterium]
MDSKTIFEPTSVPHPGETVQEYLDFLEWSQRDLARRTDLTPKTISELCNGKGPIKPPTALAFEKALGRPAHFWLNLQRQFDEVGARRREEQRASGWDAWVRQFPLKEMRQLQFSLPEGRSDADVLLGFFGVASPQSWASVWQASAVRYRQTRNMKVREEAIAAWVRETEIVARGLDLAEFDAAGLRSSITALRELTRVSVDQVMDPIQEMCAKCGVAVVMVPALRSTGISGCARWLTGKRALIGLTLRYKWDDQFWFTFFHEVGHLLLHRTKRPFVVDNADEDLSDRVVDPEMQQIEAEANRFSADTLIPPMALGAFIRAGEFTNESLYEFSETVGVGPGIVVGRLQHEGVLEPHQGNALKQKLDWGFKEEK